MTRPSRFALDLDFVAAPRVSAFGVAVLAAGIVAAVASAIVLAEAWARRDAGRERVAAAAAVGAVRDARAPADPALVRAAARVSRELRMPWGRLLADLESVQSRDVAVLVVEPVAERRLVRITADARSADAMLDYVAQLKRRSMAEVIVLSHQVQPQVPGTPIRFQLQAEWSGADAPAAPSPAREVTALAPAGAQVRASDARDTGGQP
jgi:hypothetical protein